MVNSASVSGGGQGDIGVSPDALRAVAARFQAYVRDLDRAAGALPGYYGELQWEVRQRSGLEGTVSAVSRTGRALSQQADGLAQMLNAVATAFERLDVQAESNLDRIVGVIMEGVGQLMQYNPLANLPFDKILGLLQAGDLREIARILVSNIPLPDLSHWGQLGERIAYQNGQELLNWQTQGNGVFPGLPPGVTLANLAGLGGLGGAFGFAAGTLSQADKALSERLRVAGMQILKPGSFEQTVAGLATLRAGGGVSVGQAMFGTGAGNQNAYISAEALASSAYAGYGLQADLLRGQLGGNVGVGAGYDVGRVTAGLQGRLGDPNYGLDAGLMGQVRAGANANAQAGLMADLQRGQLGGQASVGGFVGLEATAQGRAGGTVAGVNAAVTGQASARLGFGANASVNANVDLASGKFGFQANVGAAIGIGADLSFGFQIDAGQAVNNVKNAIVNLVPKIQMPKLEFPKITLPKIELPKITWPPPMPRIWPFG